MQPCGTLYEQQLFNTTFSDFSKGKPGTLKNSPVHFCKSATSEAADKATDMTLSFYFNHPLLEEKRVSAKVTNAISISSKV